MPCAVRGCHGGGAVVRGGVGGLVNATDITLDTWRASGRDAARCTGHRPPGAAAGAPRTLQPAAREGPPNHTGQIIFFTALTKLYILRIIRVFFFIHLYY